ncbi:5-oxoprolinase subunit PxpB [uncultured Rhodoblastus sp.]|uniref:5-oxoprolinase subunit PxpB n=1 Tax=uncultured Rhodoblastus sp. TaxID=543037 RepID=UPI0025E39749|nr:5-oxoprolinase subunit PxpB [uncultured Rhodoblastus sp.]
MSHLRNADVKVQALGDAALTVVFGDRIDAQTHARVKHFCAALEAGPRPEAIEEWAPAFASATVWYDPDRIAFAALAEYLANLSRESRPEEKPGALFEIPFCRDADFAPDLAETAQWRGLTPDAYMAQFSTLVFEVYMLGFQPGFAYLGGLPEGLSAPRLETPRKNVPARSLAVADGMCAAYPFASPGGWRLIGRTPAPLFDPGRTARPALLAAGDLVRWREIDRAAFLRLEREWSGGGFDARLLTEAGSWRD